MSNTPSTSAPAPFLARLFPTGQTWFWFILITALLIRVPYALVTTDIDPYLRKDALHADAASYNRLAVGLMEDGCYCQYAPKKDAFWPPLYPIS